MENLSFDGTGSGEFIKPIGGGGGGGPPPPPPPPQKEEEKKVEEQQMMEFSSSVSDLMGGPAPIMPLPQQDGSAYTNPTNGRVTGLSMGGDAHQSQKKSQNPFNLTDEQFNALLAGVIAVVVFSNAVQGRLSTLVPNFGGVNGSIASVLVAAVAYYFAFRFIKNR